jgi:hypothetical protein
MHALLSEKVFTPLPGLVTVGSEEALERHMHMPELKDKQLHPYKKLVDIPWPFMR